MITAIGLFVAGVALGALMSLLLARFAAGAWREELAQDFAVECSKVNRALTVLSSPYRIKLLKRDGKLGLCVQELAGDDERGVTVH